MEISCRNHVDFTQIKKDVQSLTLDQQKELLDLLSLNLRNQKKSTGTARDLDLWEMAVLENVEKILGSVPPRIPRKGELWMLLKESYEDLRKFIQAAKCTDLNSIEKRAFYSYLGKLLVRSAQATCSHINIPFSIKFTLQQSKNIPALFDAAFPSYIESGYVKIVVKQLFFNGNEFIKIT